MDRIVKLNRGPFVGAPEPLEPVGSPNGATVLDVRPADDFAAGHVRGAFSVPVSGSAFGTKAGFLLRSGEHVVLHASSAEEAERAAGRLYAVGILEDVGGYLVDAPATETLDPIGVEELERLLEDDWDIRVDVRDKEEHDAGYIPGSRHIPYRLLRATADDLPRDRTIVTI